MTTGLESVRRTVIEVASDVVNVPDLGRQLSLEVGRVVPHDGYMLAGVDPVSSAGCLFTAEFGYSREFNRHLDQVDPLGAEPHPFAKLLGGPRQVGVLSVGQSEYLHSIRLRGLVAEGFGSEMRIALTLGGVPVGGLVLLRERGSRPFSADEAARAEALAGPIATALKRFVANKSLRPSRHNLPPGVLLIGPDDAVRSVTPSAWEWLRLLVPEPAKADAEELIGVIWNITFMARRTRGPALSRIPASDGWIALHAQPLDGTEAGGVAVTLQPATAAVLLPAVSVWCGLTPRERSVVEQVLLGLPTKHIARRLGLSPHTVNDHLKAIYRKTGVTGREGLIVGLR
ncbi:helix-turn-helix transcriptional regulator [Streptomyces sp. NPDC020096]